MTCCFLTCTSLNYIILEISSLSLDFLCSSCRQSLKFSFPSWRKLLIDMATLLFPHMPSCFCEIAILHLLPDINECVVSNGCHGNAACINTEGSYLCECNRTFTGDGRTCSSTYFLNVLEFNRLLENQSLT